MRSPFDIDAFLIAALAEDVGTGDITSAATIPANAHARLVMRAREPLVVSGATFLPALFHLIDPAVRVAIVAGEGDRVKPRDVIAILEGPARALLSGERVALNLVQQLSGVATLTRVYVEAAGDSVRVLDTRKTVPGLRHLQKYAVRCGGGHNHRMGLYDAVLIKDNHIAIAGSITAAVQAAVAGTPPGTMIEVECDTLAQVQEALATGGVTVLLLDNMEAPTMREAVLLARGAGVLTEASGNVSLETIADIAACGVDMISVGKLTHSALAVDIGLDDQ